MQLRQRAREYVELEASTEVRSVRFKQTLSLFGDEDAVFLVTTTHAGQPEQWLWAHPASLRKSIDAGAAEARTLQHSESDNGANDSAIEVRHTQSPARFLSQPNR